MTVHHSIAASAQTTPFVGDPQSFGGRGAGLTNLPTWARTSEARALLAAIRVERPMTKLADIGDSHPRYAGKNATRLRELFALTFDMMLRDASMQRDQLIAWRKVNNSDALIGRVLGERS